MPKHLLIAAGLVLCSFITLALGLDGGSGAAAGNPDVPGKPQFGVHVIPAQRALLPLQPALAAADASNTNPFTLDRAGEVRSSRLPFPPPPQLTLPALPPLPIPQR